MSSLKIYGVPLSQPFRSVIWTLLQSHQKFQIQLTVPGATSRMGSKHESFRLKTRGQAGTVPVLEDGNSVALAESPAILSYLCESRNWTDLYGTPGSVQKAHIDSYMHWHHSNTRNIAKLVWPYFRPDLGGNSADDATTELAHGALTELDQAWLQKDEYIAGPTQTIADLLAYEEIVQTTMTDCVSLSDYSNVSAWCDRMKCKPFHDEVHQALTTLGSLTAESEIPMMKRLGAATKEGMKAIQAAQDTY